MRSPPRRSSCLAITLSSNASPGFQGIADPIPMPALAGRPCLRAWAGRLRQLRRLSRPRPVRRRGAGNEPCRNGGGDDAHAGGAAGVSVRRRPGAGGVLRRHGRLDPAGRQPQDRRGSVAQSAPRQSGGGFRDPQIRNRHQGSGERHILTPARPVAREGGLHLRARLQQPLRRRGLPLRANPA